MAQVVSRAEMLATLAAHYGPVTAVDEATSAPADRFRLAGRHRVRHHRVDDGAVLRRCDRSRLTADGVWYLCLYATRGVDLRGPLRGGRERRGAARAGHGRVARAHRPRRGDHGWPCASASPLIPLNALRRDPHLEMHTRGG